MGCSPSKKKHPKGELHTSANYYSGQTFDFQFTLSKTSRKANRMRKLATIQEAVIQLESTESFKDL
jgi:hypothetical protein